MKKSRVGVGIAGAMLLTMAGPALAAEVSRSVTITGAADVAWRYIADFCAIEKWHPAIARCEPGEANGVKTRKLTTRDGAVFHEQLLDYDAGKRTYSYAILDSPLPVADYRSTIRVERIDNMSRVVWSATFTPKGASEAEAKAVIDGIYKAGLDWLHDKAGEVD